MRRGLVFLLVFILLLLAPTAVRYARVYGLSPTPDLAPPPEYMPLNAADQVEMPPSSDFEDDPAVGQGMVLLDRAHDNDFTLEEIGYLDGRLAARGFDMLEHDGDGLATALRPVTAYVVITPQQPFAADEIQAVADFVARGGRLLLIGDPTRFTVNIIEDEFGFSFNIDKDDIPLNSLANEFDLIFNGDYLYNTDRNEDNFRNIIVDGSGLEGDLTDAVQRLVFYGTHSLQVGPNGRSLLTVDDETRSSDTDRPGALTLAADSHDGRVLALGDITFLDAPYYTSYDNSRFIAHIADFLTLSDGGDGREFVLADFPFFFDGPVDLVYSGAPNLGPDAFDEIIALQAAFRDVGQSLRLAAEPADDHHVLIAGLYNQADDDVADLLHSAEISLNIDPPIETETAVEEDEATAEPVEEVEMMRQIQSPLGNVQMSGTALLLLSEDDGRYQMVVLAASSDGLEKTIERLLALAALDADDALADCLRQESLALCPTNVADEAVEATLETGGSPDTGGGEGDTEDESTVDDEEATDKDGDGALDAVEQGTIAIDETVSGELAEGEAHAWIFDAGPATIDITLESGEGLDGVLELYDPSDELIASADNDVTGQRERLLSVEIGDDGDYTIVVRDFFGESGDYELAVTTAASDNNTIFLYIDDDGTPLSGGMNSGDALLDLLEAAGLEVAIWSETTEGVLLPETLDGYAAVIWDSGDYQSETVDESAAVLLNYLFEGGNMLITGSAPPLLEPAELTPLSDIEVAATETDLLQGLAAGDIFTLDQTYETTLLDEDNASFEEGDLVIFLRGPGSEASGSVVSAAFEDDVTNSSIFVLAAPFVALPDDVQEIILSNILDWFGLQ